MEQEMMINQGEMKENTDLYNQQLESIEKIQPSMSVISNTLRKSL